MNKTADNANLLIMWLSSKTMPVSSSCDRLWRHPLSQILPGMCTTNLLSVSESHWDWYHSSDHHITHGTGIASENTHTKAWGFSVFLSVCLVTCLHKYCFSKCELNETGHHKTTAARLSSLKLQKPIYSLHWYRLWLVPVPCSTKTLAHSLPNPVYTRPHALFCLPPFGFSNDLLTLSFPI